ncbi:sulfite exporter TauE/SafE family protein [Zobellella maritima]|uniref:sulfite exporter TauE/SafE family protein n=1 Tax=Zobellella maritima TaxID=2059725 RepID=UPI000E3034E5|nr:sulfite exporter TauE/SafE family protein [Zobellella maritima]
MLSIEWLLLYALLGTLVGFMAGLLGVGGGGILVPLLAAIFAHQGFEAEHVIHMSLGTALTCMILTSAASVRAHASRKAVEWHLVARMALGIMVGAFLASQLAAHLAPVYIALFFALFMALVAIQMFINWQPSAPRSRLTATGLVGAGIGIGSVSALAAVGGGFLAITYLNYKNITMKKAMGTSAAIGLPIAIAGAAGYMLSGWADTSGVPYTLGYVYVPAFLVLSVASMLAAPYGVRCSHRLPESSLRKVFALLSLLLSLHMLLSAVQP